MQGIEQYSDIIGLPHHRSRKHPHMPIEARAAQFSPFAALKGYDEELDETARLTHEKIELDEESKRALNEKLVVLQERLREHPTIRLTYFKPDVRKAGGEYVTIEEGLKRIDKSRRTLIFAEEEVPIEDIFAIDLL